MRIVQNLKQEGVKLIYKLKLDNALKINNNQPNFNFDAIRVKVSIKKMEF